MKPYAVKCDCVPCQQIAAIHGLDMFNWFCDTRRPMDFAIIPAFGTFDEEARETIFAALGIPEHYRHMPYELPPEKYEIRWACKFVDIVERYQAAELVVRRHNDTWYCRLARYEKWFEGVEEVYDFIQWTGERELALPDPVEWVLQLGFQHSGITQERVRTAVAEHMARQAKERMKSAARRLTGRS